MLDKPGVFGNHTNRAKGSVFFSITPEQHWKGGQGLRDYVVEKGPISLCWVCVGVLEVRLALVSVPLALQ